MRLLKPETDKPVDPIMEVLARLWQTKLRSISFLEEWIPRATDFGIRAGLQAHLAEERRHQRILGAEIAQRGGRKMANVLDQVLDKPFALVRAQPDDLSRVRMFHNGIKKSTVFHCARIIPLVDIALGRLLEQITRDEERHIRWAEIRLAQTRNQFTTRHLDPVLTRVEDAMCVVWSQSWRRLTAFQRGRRAG